MTDMATENSSATMDIDSGAPSNAQTEGGGDSGSGQSDKKPRFEIKKYNAVALWAWGKLYVHTTNVESFLLNICFASIMHRYC